MFCPKCGANVPDGSKFCETCGNSLAEQDIQAQPETQQPAESAQPAQPAQQPACQPQPQAPAYQPQPQAPAYQPQPQPSYQQQSYQQQTYQPRPQPAPSYQNNTYGGADPRDKVMSVGAWLLTYLVMLVPIVNIVMIFVWAFGSKANKNKKNWAIAGLIMGVIGIVLSIILSASIASVIQNIFDQMGDGGLYFPE